MTEQTELAVESGAPNLSRLREHDADFTPVPVVRQGLEWLRDRFFLRPMRVIDPMAGAGVFAMVAREVFPEARTIALEVRDEEVPNLVRNADAFEICDAISALDEGLVPPSFRRLKAFELHRFDLVVTNPAFSLIPELLPLLVENAPAGRVIALLGLNELGSRGPVTYDLWRRFPPHWQARIAGTIGFRGPGINPDTGKRWGVDTRSYSWWVWTCDGKGGTMTFTYRHDDFAPLHGHKAWITEDLPMLPGPDRRWKIRPGTEWQQKGAQ